MIKFTAEQIRYPYVGGVDVLDALRDAAVEMGTEYVDFSIEKAEARGKGPLESFALSAPADEFADELRDDALLWDGAVEAFLRDRLADGEPTDGLDEVVSEELSRLFPLVLAAAKTRCEEQLKRYTPPDAGKTYRELLAVAGVPDTDGNLWELGDWLGDEGARALQFPDAVPENMPGWGFPVEFLEARVDVLESEDKEEEE